MKALVGHSRNMDTFGVYGHTVGGYTEDTSHKLGDIFYELLNSNKEDKK